MFLNSLKPHLCLALLATLICTGAALASQEAEILVDQAVIYSDPQLLSPIGRVSRGKRILIGDKKRNSGKTYSTVVNGRVAYIRVHDVQTMTQIVDEENTLEKIKRKMQAFYSRKIEFRGFYHSSTITNTAEEDSESESNKNFTGGGIRGHVLSRSSRTMYRLSLDYMAFSEDGSEIRIYNMDLEAAFALILFQKSRVNIYAGLRLVPHAQIATSLFTKNGYGGGAAVGLEFAIGVADRTTIHIDGSYQYILLTGFNIPDEVDLDFKPSIHGPRASLGISYAF